jgi:hypothetical protein
MKPTALIIADNARANNVLYLAVSESQLVSRVLRGENGGATLMHDGTVRRRIGPIALLDGSARVRQEVQIPPDWSPKHLSAAAFVQNLDAGTILQAVSTARCVYGNADSEAHGKRKYR